MHDSSMAVHPHRGVGFRGALTAIAADAGLVAVHMVVEASPAAYRMGGCHVADCSARVRKVLKSVWEVEAMSPGVADHIILGIFQHASGFAVGSR